MIRWLSALLSCALLIHAAPAVAETPPLDMGFYLPAIRDANLADIKISLGIWAEEIGKPYGVKIRAATYDDMEAMRRALDRKEINFISAPGMELAEVLGPDELRQGYARRHHGIDEGVALVVHTSSGIGSFADLRGKRVARLNRDHLSEYFLETQCLKAAGLECREFLSLSEEKRDIQSVYNVFFGRVDAALVQLSTLRTAEELNPQVAKRLKILSEWKAKALFFGMMTRHTDESYRSLIINSANEAIKSTRGRQLLELFKTDYLEPVDADALMPFSTLLREYNELRRARLGRKK
jgi:ABC-type phosphate/phosphonate transport system substrate-binding protein